MTILIDSELLENEELELKTKEKNLHRERRERSQKKKKEASYRENSRKADTQRRGSKGRFVDYDD